MDRWKSRGGKSQRREAKRRRKKIRERRSEKRKSQKTEDAGAQKGSKVAKLCVFPMICSSVRSKSRLAKALGAAELSGEMRWTNWTPLWCEAHFQAKTYKAHILGPLLEVDLQVKICKAHHPQTNFWKLTCRKSARRCGAKHISKSKCTKHTILGPLLEVDMSKKRTPLWREAHFEVKSVKNTRGSDHFWGSMSFRVADARDCAPLQKWAKREGFVAFPKTMAGVGHLKRICKDAFSVAGAVQKTWVHERC